MFEHSFELGFGLYSKSHQTEQFTTIIAS